VEDAFQATFLVLLRKAGSIRNRASCASWLHGVAFRAAAEIRSAAGRRRTHERRAAKCVEASDVAEASDDLRAVIDEGLARLRERYRSPLVLCYLEGHTCEEAAQRLGWPIGTVKSRLARGRARLRSHLVRRGVGPSVSLAVAANLPAPAQGAVPRALVTKLVDVASRVMSGRSAPTTIAALVRAEVRRGLLARAARIGVVLLGAGLAVVSIAGLAGQKPGDDPKPATASAAPKPVDPDPVHARVVDRAGKAVPAAVVQVFGAGQKTGSLATDAGGRAVIPREQVGDYSFSLVCRHGNALGWAAGNSTDRSGTAKDPLVLTLMPLSRQVHGSVVDSSGNPIGGVSMTVVTAGRPGDISVFLVPHGWNKEVSSPLGGAVSDAQGRYVLSLPEDSTASVWALHPRYVGPGINAGKGGPTPDPLILEPAGGITGTITDAATGEAVAGAQLGAQLMEHNDKMFNGAWGEAVSDARGRFTMGGLQPGVYNLLFQRVPGRERAAASAVEAVRVRANEDAPADLKVIEGRPLRGIVIDAKTDRPAPEMQVGCYGPAHPRSGAAVESRKTDAEGRFTFFVPPGEQYVYVMDGSSLSRLGHDIVVVPEQGDVRPVRLLWDMRVPKMFGRGGVAKAVAPAKKEVVKKEVVKDSAYVQTKKPLPAKPAAPAAKAPEVRTVTGQVLDPQDRPVPGVSVYVNPSSNAPGEPPNRFDSGSTDRQGVFIIQGLPRRELSIVLNRSGYAMETKTLAADQDVAQFVYESTRDPRVALRPKAATDDPVPPDLKARLTFVNLDSRGNEFVVDGPGGGGNDLARLPRGVHLRNDTFFRVGEKIIHLPGQHAPGPPDAVNAIPVGARANKVHIMHAVQFGDPAGTEVGAYVVHYVDGTSERIPIVYGRDVANWFLFPRARPETPTDARVAWTGTNDSTDLNPGLTVRLFAMTWTNPHPDREIAAIDVTSKVTASDLFLVAVTLERDEPIRHRER
jgi:RNA polymerase sigma factor (sigma-70 family)